LRNWLAECGHLILFFLWGFVFHDVDVLQPEMDELDVHPFNEGEDLLCLQSIEIKTIDIHLAGACGL
jgi:hypothetical protein